MAFASVLVFSLLLAGCTGIPNPPKATAEECNKYGDSDAYYHLCFANLAVQNENLGECQNVQAGTMTKAENIQLCEENVANQCSCNSITREDRAAFCDQVKAKGIAGACD